MKNRITIGISSVVLIFMILCLAVFSLLSLTDAKSALIFAQKRADTVQMYYESDISAQTFIRDYRNLYYEGVQPSDILSTLYPSLPAGSQVTAASEDLIICELPIRSGQTLHLELEADGSRIQAYYVSNNTDYVIDSDLPVWSGN